MAGAAEILGTLMSKKVVHVVMVAAALGTLVFLYMTFRSNTFRVEDILAVYQQNADYGDITCRFGVS